ncbi:hypothetical protein M231_03436 [Tremella mesenterica]|uniref:Uncharacterized protein n=1 Tax=Tremella mesenterica TaxID=5217 RepID=A0A4V1M472_TREME|nr:hypothetical protein M231_03436 [Tremella mesenterica]
MTSQVDPTDLRLQQISELNEVISHLRPEGAEEPSSDDPFVDYPAKNVRDTLDQWRTVLSQMSPINPRLPSLAQQVSDLNKVISELGQSEPVEPSSTSQTIEDFYETRMKCLQATRRLVALMIENVEAFYGPESDDNVPATQPKNNRLTVTAVEQLFLNRPTVDEPRLTSRSGSMSHPTRRAQTSKGV